MSFFSAFQPTATALLVFVVCSVFGSLSFAMNPKPVDYELSLSFVPANGQLIGTAKITIIPGLPLTLSLARLDITGTLLQDESGSEHKLMPTQGVLLLPAAQTSRTLYLSYTRTIKNDFDNLISPHGISLTSNWYPIPENPMKFMVTATLPKGFMAIMESDSFPLTQQGDTVTASFSKPVTTIHFNAGPYTLGKRQVRDNLFVYSMFFKEDKELANDYLKAAADFLNRYESEIGPYPYNHYVIVANRLPTGYGMPTYTLLGQMVLRLPFIKETSLGHEIVHSWFGNEVGVDYSLGNWCEGLASFLADHSYREEKGEGVEDRKGSITRYLSYVHKESAIPLAAFNSASHNQPMAEARRAVGYNRGSLLFHELRVLIGREQFGEGLRSFYADNRGKDSSWEDLRRSFESASGADLHTFFSERLTRTDIASLAVQNVEIKYSNNKPVLSFSLLQESEKPYSLMVPIQVKTISEVITVNKKITEQFTPISIALDQLPLEFTLDPEYAFLRRLTDRELPPVWSQFMGGKERMVILTSESDRQTYQPFIDTLTGQELHLTTADTVTNKDLSEHDLLFLGLDQAPARSLFGLVKHPSGGLTLDVRQNPLNKNHTAVLISSSGTEQTASVARKLRHYGKYSYLEFKNGRNIVKRIQPASSGIRIVLEELPGGGETAGISSFDTILEKLAGAQVVYVGEGHTSLPDHMLQLRIIEGLYKKNPNLAIGMEMFPASSQPILDQYTQSGGEMDERTFLKESDYYNVWKYDYRFYRDILNFAKKHQIPLIGLNLDRQIVSEVFRTGGTDSLSKEVLESLPADRDLDMDGYAERLSMMHGVHMQGNHGSGAASGFIQAQALWDETMAENITSFLTEQPDFRVIVLAGSQHTRKDSGIPPRVARRLQVKQASVLNINNNSSPGNLERVADYYFLASGEELPETPKIGIVLLPQTAADNNTLIISSISPHGKAAAAGLLKGDVLKEINGFPVTNMADLRIAMLDTKAGDTIDIKIFREENGQSQEISLNVELTNPPASEPHP
jgi:aminopeptidase N